MFTKKDDLMDTKGFNNRTKTNMFTISKFPATKFGETSSSKNKLMLVKGSNIPDLSLNTLTK